MRDIVTDLSVLRKKSQPLDVNNVSLIQSRIKQLLEACPGNEAGLAAVQIGILERVFIANLTKGRFAFINPNLQYTLKSNSAASIEGCLSIPDTVCCVERRHHLDITADAIYKIDEDHNLSEISGPLHLQGQDSFIVQHEYDHLEGVLIIDLPQVKTAYQKKIEKHNRKNKKVAIHNTSLCSNKINPKKYAKWVKQMKSADKQRRKRLYIQEKYKFQQENNCNS